jgi:hypothetical protein
MPTDDDLYPSFVNTTRASIDDRYSNAGRRGKLTTNVSFLLLKNRFSILFFRNS